SAPTKGLTARGARRRGDGSGNDRDDNGLHSAQTHRCPRSVGGRRQAAHVAATLQQQGVPPLVHGGTRRPDWAPDRGGARWHGSNVPRLTATEEGNRWARTLSRKSLSDSRRTSCTRRGSRKC